MNNQIKMEPINDASLWSAEDFVDDSWIWKISEEELQELDNALRGIQAKGLKLGEFTQQDFPLPIFSKKLADIKNELINGVRFALIRKLPVEKYSVEELELIYWGIGTYFGNGITQNAKGALLTHVTHHGLDPTKGTVRGYQDRRHQEPHNDLADVVGLLCVRKAKSGGASSVVNAPAVYNEILRTRPDLLPVFYRGFHLDFRGEGKDPNATTDYRVPTFGVAGGKLTLFFGRRSIDAAFIKRGETPTKEESEALDLMEKLIEKPEYRTDMQLETGDIQLVNNYAVMHARTAYQDYEEPERWRLMLRLWLNLEDIELPEALERFSRSGFSKVAIK